jgi:hypothetical protein
MVNLVYQLSDKSNLICPGITHSFLWIRSKRSNPPCRPPLTLSTWAAGGEVRGQGWKYSDCVAVAAPLTAVTAQLTAAAAQLMAVAAQLTAVRGPLKATAAQVTEAADLTPATPVSSIFRGSCLLDCPPADAGQRNADAGGGRGADGKPPQENSCNRLGAAEADQWLSAPQETAAQADQWPSTPQETAARADQWLTAPQQTAWADPLLWAEGAVLQGPPAGDCRRDGCCHLAWRSGSRCWPSLKHQSDI